MKRPSTEKLTDSQLSELAQVFAAMAEPSRLKLLRALMDGPQTVTALVKAVGLKQGNVSKHLSILASASIVIREQEGNFARYSIADPRVYDLCRIMCQRPGRSTRGAKS